MTKAAIARSGASRITSRDVQKASRPKVDLGEGAAELFYIIEQLKILSKRKSEKRRGHHDRKFQIQGDS